MKMHARVLGASVIVLALGVLALTTVGNGGAADDKASPWKPILAEADGNDLIKLATGVLQDDLKAGTPTAADVTKALMEETGKPPTEKELDEGLQKAAKQWNQKLQGSAILIAAVAQSSKGDAQQLATIRDAAMTLKSTLAKKNYDEAKKQVAALPALKADPKAVTRPVALTEKGDLEKAMRLLKVRDSGGLGFASKPVKGTPDGMESRLLALQRKALTPTELATQADDIVRMANVLAVIAQMTEANTPAKKVGDKDPKDWRAFQEAMLKNTLALGEAARKKDPKESPAAIRTIAKALNDSCSSCHEKFPD